MRWHRGQTGGLGTDNHRGYEGDVPLQSLHLSRAGATGGRGSSGTPRSAPTSRRCWMACEGAICRLTYDGRYFARPARTLFNDVRAHFTVNDQLFVWTVIQRNIEPGARFPFALARGRRAGRTAAAVPGAYAQRHAVSAPAAPGQGLLPVAQAPGGDVRGRRAAARGSRPRAPAAGRLAGKRAGDDPGRGRDRHLPQTEPVSGSPRPTAVGSERMLLGVDVGGTFTDAVLFDGRALHTAKAPTTPDDQSAGRARRGRGGAWAGGLRAPDRSRRSPTA